MLRQIASTSISTSPLCNADKAFSNKVLLVSGYMVQEEMPFTKQVGWLHTLFRHSDKRGGERDGPIESVGDTEDARMDSLVAHADSSDYMVNIVNSQAKTIQLLQEEIRELHHRLLQQNHATSISGISKEVEGQYGSIEPTWDTRKETTLVNHAVISDPCSKKIEHLEKVTQEVTQKLRMKEVEGQYGSIEPMSNTGKEAPLVKHAAIPDTFSQNTESSDILTVKQGMLIQHLEEKVSEMKQKLKRMDQVIRQLEFDYQETLTMLSVAKDFFSCFVPTEAAANAAISFFTEKDDDIVQKIDHMKVCEMNL
ncbi:hypothetical protein EJB05_51211, partial [Eragrostis curvula]